MFGIGGFELFLILLFGFLIFGPDKLPEIATMVGKGIARFRQAQNEMNDVIKSTDIYDPNSDEPFKDPMLALDKLAKHQEEKGSAARAGKTGSAGDAQKGTASGAAGAASGAAGAASATGAPRQESFTERKARYERERAARKAAEEQAAKEGASASAAPEPAAKPGAADEKPAAETQSSTPAASGESAASTEEVQAQVVAEGGER